MIYLDNAATSKVYPRVMAAMLPYFISNYGNPGSIHGMGQDAAEAVRTAREQCAKPINADPGEIIFTAGGSESNTLAIHGIAKYLKEIGKTHIITSVVEHPSVLNNVKALQSEGFSVDYVSVDVDGNIFMDDLRKLAREDTGLVTIMAVNNETGNLYDIHQIGKFCHDRGIIFHTDCVQAFGGVHIDVKDDYIDMLSVSGHKFHAPKGIGFLYCKDAIRKKLSPVIIGGGQELGMRSGTENVPGIVGIGEAAAIAYENINNPHNKAAREAFMKVLDESGVEYFKNGTPHDNSKTMNLCFPGVDNETLVLDLSGRGIMVSAGSACSSHEVKPSHVLKAMGRSDNVARNSIRVSFSEETPIDEMETAAKAVIKSVEWLRKSHQ